MTYADIERGARKLVQDESASARYTMADMYGYVNEAVRTLFKIRPTAFYVNGRMPTALAMEPATVDAAVAVTGELQVSTLAGDRYLDAFVYFVAGKCLGRDDSDTLNIGLADNYMQKFAEYARA